MNFNQSSIAMTFQERWFVNNLPEVMNDTKHLINLINQGGAMNSSVMEVPVEVQSTTNQINNMLTKINEQQSMIERLKEIRNKYADAAVEFDRHSMKIKELKDAIKEERKLIEMLVEYVKNNYGFDFVPGSLFNNSEELTEESE